MALDYGLITDGVTQSEDYGATTSSVTAYDNWGLITPSIEPVLVTFNLTGQSATLVHGYTLTAAKGTFTLAGQASGVLFGRHLTAGIGAFSLTGNATALLAARVVGAGSGTFTLIGKNAGFVSGPLMQVTAGVFALTGKDAALRAARVLTATSRSFAVTGQNVAFIRGRTMPATGASFILTGQISGLLAGRSLQAAKGTFLLTGNAASIFTVTPQVFGFYESVAVAIRTHLASVISVPTQYDNQAFAAPTGTIWARAFIGGAVTRQISSGNGNGFRTEGKLLVSLFGPIELGDGGLLAIADELRAGLRERTVDGVRFRIPSVEQKGVDGDEWRIDVRCPYIADQVKPLQAGSDGLPTVEEIGNAIRARFDAVATAESLAVQYDNQAFDPAGLAQFARFTVLFGESSLAQMGRVPRYRTVGVAVAQLFGRIELGDDALYQTADAIGDAFRCVTESGVTFKSPSVKVIGRSGQWWQINVSCPFSADEVAPLQV